MGEGGGLALRATEPGHVGATPGAGEPEVVELEAPPWAEDGNSVFAEREAACLVANQLQYTGVARGVAKHLALLRYAASDGRA
jgi:flagellar basal body rod protein FlgB